MPAMIVAPQPIAVEEGAKVLSSGGNAFDAAVAAAVVQGVIDPHSCGLGGYLVMTYHRAGQTSFSPLLDAPAIAGSLVKGVKVWTREPPWTASATSSAPGSA